MTDFRDRDGKPLRLLTWGMLMEQPSYRIVARDAVVSTMDTTTGYSVSTIWIGFDDTHWRWTTPATAPPPPLIFETAVLMISANRHNPDLIETWRCATEAEARRQHDLAVKWASTKAAAPIVIRVPAVPSRPRAGWNIRYAVQQRGRCRACRRRVPLTTGGNTCSHTERSGQSRHCAASHLPPAMEKNR